VEEEKKSEDEYEQVDEEESPKEIGGKGEEMDNSSPQKIPLEETYGQNDFEEAEVSHHSKEIQQESHHSVAQSIKSVKSRQSEKQSIQSLKDS